MLPSLILTLRTMLSYRPLGINCRLLLYRVPHWTFQLSSSIEVSPECTTLHCLSGSEPETLIHDGKVLSWSGTADYWTPVPFQVSPARRERRWLSGNDDVRHGRPTGSSVPTLICTGWLE